MPTAQQVYSMLGNENLWQAAAECHRALTEAQVPYSICGGVAVCLHGYQRNTVDLDLIIRKADSQQVKNVLENIGLEWDPVQAEFRSPGGVPVQFLNSGDRAGNGAEVYLPDPPRGFPHGNPGRATRFAADKTNRDQDRVRTGKRPPHS